MQYHHLENIEKETTGSFGWKCYELSHVIPPDTGTVSTSVLNTSRYPFAYISLKRYISAVIGFSRILLVFHCVQHHSLACSE